MPATFTVFHDYDALGNPVNPEEAVGDIDHEPLPAPVRSSKRPDRLARTPRGERSRNTVAPPEAP